MGKGSKAKIQATATAKKAESRRQFFARFRNAASKASEFAKREVAYKKTLPWQMTRRELLTRTGLAGLGSLIGWKALRPERNIEYWLGKKRYHAKIVFLRHGGTEHANQIRKMMEGARAAGQPFHLIFEESANVTKENYESLVRERMAADAEARRIFAIELQRRGNDRGAALKAVTDAYYKIRLTKNRPSDAMFKSVVEVSRAVEGVRAMPLEIGAAQSTQRSLERSADMFAGYEKIEKLVSEAGSLGEIQKEAIRSTRIAMELAKERDEIAGKGIEEKFKLARKLFPELKNEKELRALVFMGLGHGAMITIAEKHNPNVDITESRVKPGSLVDELGIQTGRTQSYGEKEGRIEALARAAYDSISDSLASGPNASLIPLLRKRILTITQGEFEALDRATRGMNKIQRAQFIITALTGTQLR